MKFENKASDGGSYEKPKEGKYIGVLVGFADVGTHGGGQYGPKHKVMLRWELHKRRGPSLDSKGFVHTVTAQYGATVRGENSLLRKCLEAHGLEIPEGYVGDSHEWLGRAAWLDLELSGDQKWVNVGGVSKLDPDDDGIPDRQLEPEHWEPEDGANKLPSWAAWAVARSQDLAHLAPKKPGTPATAAVGATVANPDADVPF